MLLTALLLVVSLAGVIGEENNTRQNELDERLHNEQLSYSLLKEVWDDVANKYAKDARQKIQRRMMPYYPYGYPRYRRQAVTAIEPTPTNVRSPEVYRHKQVHTNEQLEGEGLSGGHLERTESELPNREEFKAGNSKPNEGERRVPSGYKYDVSRDNSINEVEEQDDSSPLKDLKMKKVTDEEKVSDQYGFINSTDDLKENENTLENPNVLSGIVQNSETQGTNMSAVELSPPKAFFLWNLLQNLLKINQTDTDGLAIDQENDGSKLKSLFEDDVSKGLEGQRELNGTGRCLVRQCSTDDCHLGDYNCSQSSTIEAHETDENSPCDGYKNSYCGTLCYYICTFFL